jgi:hypothetical protein
MQTKPAFLRGNIEGASSLVSAWLRGLESTEEQIGKWTEGLSQEGLWWEAAAGTNTIGGLINHIGITNQRLVSFARGIPLRPELEKTAPQQLAPSAQSLGQVMEGFKAAQAEVKEALMALKAEDLETLRERMGSHVPAVHLLHKLVEHSHEHVGQIITLRKLWNARQ